MFSLPRVFQLDLSRVCQAAREKAGTLGDFQDNRKKPNISENLCCLLALGELRIEPAPPTC